MTQRNPMNDRYQSEEHHGKTRRSAASAKPKSKAAASVRVQPKEKTKQQKRAEKKAVRQKQSELDRKYYNPPTEEYKRLRKIWWALLIGAIVMTVLSWLARSVLPEGASYVTLGLAYLFIIAALYVDISKVRKVRRAYREEMESGKSKEQRALEKREKAAQRDMKKDAEEKYEEVKATTEQPKIFGLFGKGSHPSKSTEDDSTDQEVEADKTDSSTDEGNSTFARGKAQEEEAARTAKKRGSHDSHDSNE